MANIDFRNFRPALPGTTVQSGDLFLYQPVGATEPLAITYTRMTQLFSGGGGGGTTYIDAGTNVTITGTGTLEDPYVINSSGGGGGASTFEDLTGDPMDNTLLSAKFDSITEKFEELYTGKGVLEFAAYYTEEVQWTSMSLRSEIAQLEYSLNDDVYTTPTFPVNFPAGSAVNYRVVYVDDLFNLSSFILRFTKV